MSTIFNNLQKQTSEDIFFNPIALTKRLSTKEQTQLIDKLRSLPPINQKIGDLIEALKRGNWRAPIFSDPDFPYYALLACNQGLITSHQFGTIQIYWSTIQYHEGKKNVCAAPIFKYDDVVPEAAQAIFETLFLNPETALAQMGLYDPNIPLLTEKQFEAFFEQLNQLPASEQYVFLVHDKDPISPDLPPTISQRLYLGTGYNVFCRNIEAGTRMVPSIGMMQAFLNVRYGKNAVQLNPVIGLSSEADIRQNGLESKRDTAVCFPGVELPEEADTFRAPWYDFTYHDFYHAMLASGIPVQYRPLLVQIADIAKSILQTTSNPQDQALMNKIYDQFIDMEQTNFRPEKSSMEKTARPEAAKPHMLFWRAVYSTILIAMIHVQAENYNVDMLSSLCKRIASELIVEPSLMEEFSTLDSIEKETLQYSFGDLENLPPQLTKIVETIEKIQPGKIMSEIWIKRIFS